MSKLSSITPPVWIFVCTLLLIIFTGGLVGSSPCERAITECQASAAKTYPNNEAQQQTYISECSAPACGAESSKTSAFVPFSLIILGFVLYQVWVRQGNSGSMSFSGGEPALAGASPARAGAPKASPAPAAAKKSAAPAKPKAKAKKAQAPAPAPAASDDLKPAQEKFCLEVLADGEKSREEITDMLGKLTGSSDPELWKGGPLNDLEVLAKALSMAALIGPSGSKYRSAVAGKGALNLGDMTELEARTKKELHEQCVSTLTQDVKAMVAAGKYPAALSADVASSVAAAAQSADGLDGISRCSKAGLVYLAAFLGQS